MIEPDLLLEPTFVADGTQVYAKFVHEVAWDERMRTRKTACFGQAYNYSGMTYPTVPMHPLLVPIIAQLTSRIGYQANTCLLNFYASGESTMGFHADSEDEMVVGTGVAIVSLGAERSITFRSIADTAITHTYPLPNGSLLYMRPGVQQQWKHAILKQEDTGGRISLSFRLLRTA